MLLLPAIVTFLACFTCPCPNALGSVRICDFNSDHKHITITDSQGQKYFGGSLNSVALSIRLLNPIRSTTFRWLRRRG